MKEVTVAGLRITAETKSEVLSALAQRLTGGQKTFLTTPYSEFLVAALKDKQVMEQLNRADIAIADGIGLLWAATYLAVPLTASSYVGKILQAFWQLMKTGVSILFWPKQIKQVIPEKIVGADFIWDLASLATSAHYSLYLLGGFGNTTRLAAEHLKNRYPDLDIAGTSNKNPDDPTVLADIQATKPDLLLVAYGPIRQEQWLIRNWEELPIKLGVGLGGTFDYLAGTKVLPPAWVRNSGLEWFWRLLTQPKRYKRIWTAVWGLSVRMLRYKVHSHLTYRDNAVVVVVNKQRQLLLGQRSTWSDLAFPHHDQQDTNGPHWCFPQGGVKSGESASLAAEREGKEETGLAPLIYLATSDHTHTYDWSLTERPVLRSWPYRGQFQRIVYLYYPGDTPPRMQKLEFSDYQWVSIDQLLQVIHPFRKQVAEIVQSDWEEIQSLVKEREGR